MCGARRRVGIDVCSYLGAGQRWAVDDKLISCLRGCGNTRARWKERCPRSERCGVTGFDKEDDERSREKAIKPLQVLAILHERGKKEDELTSVVNEHIVSFRGFRGEDKLKTNLLSHQVRLWPDDTIMSASSLGTR